MTLTHRAPFVGCFKQSEGKKTHQIGGHLKLISEPTLFRSMTEEAEDQLTWHNEVEHDILKYEVQPVAERSSALIVRQWANSVIPSVSEAPVHMSNECNCLKQLSTD